MTLTASSDSFSEDSFPKALSLSILLHLVLVIGLSLKLQLPTNPPERFLKVSLLQPPEAKTLDAKPREPKPPQIPIPQTQLVSPSEGSDVSPEIPTRLLSDKDSRVAKEQIKRGLDPAPLKSEKPKTASAASTKSASAASKSNNKPAKPEPLEFAKLKLSDDQLLKTFQQEKSAIKQNSPYNSSPVDSRSADDRNLKLKEYSPFSHSALDNYMPGIPDFLPNIQDGEVTLLNTKADKHAVFVRRVALQVFGSLRAYSWAKLPAAEFARVKEFVTIHAVLSPEGKLLSTKIEESSGSPSFDNVLKSAADKSAWDQNPPASAKAEDGNIHFIFKSRSWSRAGAQMQEERWILLATGLL
jgi:hypothetical protein